MIIEEVANDIFTLLKQRIIEEYPEAQFSSKISRLEYEINTRNLDFINEVLYSIEAIKLNSTDVDNFTLSPEDLFKAISDDLNKTSNNNLKEEDNKRNNINKNNKLRVNPQNNANNGNNNNSIIKKVDNISLSNITSSDNILDQISDSNFHNKNFSFNKVQKLYPPNTSLITPQRINSKPIEYNRIENELEEYSLIPKDMDSYLSSYQESILKIREKMIVEYKIKESDLNEERVMIMIVSIETTQFDIDEIFLIDPLNLKKYKLRFDECENLKNNFDFFNGQIVKIEGVLREKEVYPNSIVNGFPLVKYNLLENTLSKYYKEPAAYEICSMFGPFFSNDNLDFTLFTRSLKNIRMEDPHALIIGGPFVPNFNNKITQGLIVFKTKNEVEASFNYYEVFQMFLERINEIFKNSRTQIFIVPSLNDVINYFPLPQPPYDLSFINHNNLSIYQEDRLHFLSNPATINLNEVIIGICNCEYFEEVKQQSSFKTNNINSVFNTILTQRSYYPLIPYKCDDKDDKNSTIIEQSQLDRLQLEVIPDIFIYPNKSITYAKDFFPESKSVFVHPGSVCASADKPESFKGNYIRMFIYPNTKTDLDIYKRLKIEKVIIEEGL